MFKRLIASLLCLTFSLSNLQYVQAQDFSINQLPVPGTMVGESAPFSPLALKGLIVNPQKPLEFQFIVDTGNSLPLRGEGTGGGNQEQIKQQANQLVKYFLAGLTIPEGDLWVNLSPYEKNRMVPEALGQTDLGRDLLAQDYILKQLTASLIYPEKDLGKEFWSRVYAKAQAQFGTTDIPVNTFNKVWILPNEAQVFEKANAAYVTKATLKVMLDEDYLAMQKHNSLPLEGRVREGGNNAHTLASNIIRQIILPEIEKEVNTGKNFAPLRQIYQALILAKWYKETIQNGLLDALYTNKNKVAGVNLNDPTIKEQIYERYLKAYKKGVFNYIKDDSPPLDGEGTGGVSVPRKYFSGGILPMKVRLKRSTDTAMLTKILLSLTAGALFLLTVSLGDAKAQNNSPSPLIQYTQTHPSAQKIIKDKVTAQPSEQKDAATLNVTSQEALEYQKEMRTNFAGRDSRAERQFNSKKTGAQKVARNIRDNNGNAESMLQHIQLNDNLKIRGIYEYVQQEIIRKVVGADTPVLDMNLDEIHVTIANDDVAPHESLSITLDQLERDIREDARGVKPFNIELVGPHLMSDGVVVMEYTTTAPEFLYLRKKAADRRSHRHLSQGNSASIPDIMHSTVSSIRDPKVSQETLHKLKERLDAYRSSLMPIEAVVNKITATHFRQIDRRFIEPRDIPLVSTVFNGEPEAQHQPLDAAMAKLMGDTVDEEHRYDLLGDDKDILVGKPTPVEGAGGIGSADFVQVLRMFKPFLNLNMVASQGGHRRLVAIDTGLHKGRNSFILRIGKILEMQTGIKFFPEDISGMLSITQPGFVLKLDEPPPGFFNKGKRAAAAEELEATKAVLLAKIEELEAAVLAKARQPKRPVQVITLNHSAGVYKGPLKEMVQVGFVESSGNLFVGVLGKRGGIPLTTTAKEREANPEAVKVIVVGGNIIIKDGSNVTSYWIDGSDALVAKHIFNESWLEEGFTVNTQEGILGNVTSLNLLGEGQENANLVFVGPKGPQFLPASLLSDPAMLENMAPDDVIANAVGIAGAVMIGFLFIAQAFSFLTSKEKKQWYQSTIGQSFIQATAIVAGLGLIYGVAAHFVPAMRPHLQEAIPTKSIINTNPNTNSISTSLTNSQLAKPSGPGGIDLNQINVKRNGRTVSVQFDQAQLDQLMQGGFKGFVPVIINIKPISSPFQLLGINPVKETEVLAKA